MVLRKYKIDVILDLVFIRLGHFRLILLTKMLKSTYLLYFLNQLSLERILILIRLNLQ